jgi:hypothetical protein
VHRTVHTPKLDIAYRESGLRGFGPTLAAQPPITVPTIVSGGVDAIHDPA